MEELINLDLIDQAISLVAPRKSGKSHLLTHLLLHTLDVNITKNTTDNNINIVIFCQSLIDSCSYYQLYIYTFLDECLLLPNDNARLLIDTFHLKEHIQPRFIQTLCQFESDHTIKTILHKFINYLIISNQCNPIEKRRFKNCRYYFNGSISSSIMKRLCSPEHKSDKQRKYIVIIDDVKAESYRDIKKDVVYMYEQGRHHGLSVVIVDQYIKSTKVPPEVRLTSSHLMFRSFDENIKKEICNICAINKNDIDNEIIRNLINEYYAIIVDFNDKTKIYYIKASKDLFEYIYNKD